MLYNKGMSENARADTELSTQRRARILGLDYVDTSQIADKTLYKDLLSVPELKQMRIVPLRADQSNILFGITTSTSQQVIADLRQRYTDQRVAYAVISDVGYQEYMVLYDPPKQIIYQDISLQSAGTDQQIQDVTAALSQVRADDMLAYLVEQAHNLGASDIHAECQRDHVRIRFRIDGVLHPIAELPYDKYRLLISAIASSGNVSTSAPDAQQGHIAQRLRMANGSEVDINVRLETVPTINGMDFVMRLFNMDAGTYVLDKLGLASDERAIVDEIIAKPSGLVMAVGPTGSGKTTTLYSMLNSLNSDERKIITIEDPVEYQFPGIVQISVTSQNANDNSFAEKLRAVLRLDPDIVMVGEIRDNDTAKTALQASLTGHLVMSTFHASSAAAALTRLIDVIGLNPLFVSAIRLVMAQRLVRRLDVNTRQAYTPSEAERKQIQDCIDTLPEGVERPNLDGIQLYKQGSSPENPYGFKGQIAIRELFRMSGDIRALLESANTRVISTHDIEAAAIHSGMKTMLQDGILKVIAGETTLEEVYRVVG